jgi:hypothetical protein
MTTDPKTGSEIFLRILKYWFVEFRTGPKPGRRRIIRAGT